MEQPSLSTIDTVPLNIAARRLRVPSRWLRDEIDAGRVPALIAGRAVLVHVPTVAALLSERAKRLAQKAGAA